MNNLEQNSNLINKTYTVTSGSDYINFSARGADLILIPSQSFTNYAIVHRIADIDEYGITIPYEYASMVGYSYKNVYEYINLAMKQFLNEMYPNCNSKLIESFIENEITALLEYVCDNKKTKENIFNYFDLSTTLERFDNYFKHSVKPVVFSYIKTEGSLVRQHDVKIFDNYENAINYFNEQVNAFKNKEWYQKKDKDSDDIWLTDKPHEFSFEDASDNYGSHYFRIDF